CLPPLSAPPPPASAPAPPLPRSPCLRTLLVRLHVRQVLPREQVLPFRQLLVALPCRRDGQLEYRERLREVALPHECLRRRTAAPALTREDGLREQDHPRPLRDPPRQPRGAHHLREHDVRRDHVLRQAPGLHVRADRECRVAAQTLVVQVGRFAERAFRQRSLRRVLGFWHIGRRLQLAQLALQLLVGLFRGRGRLRLGGLGNGTAPLRIARQGREQRREEHRVRRDLPCPDVLVERVQRPQVAFGLVPAPPLQIRRYRRQQDPQRPHFAEQLEAAARGARADQLEHLFQDAGRRAARDLVDMGPHRRKRVRFQLEGALGGEPDRAEDPHR